MTLGWNRDPNVADVVSSLVMDASSAYMDFNDFCSEFGCDTDSRSARATWRAVQSSGKKTQKLFGSDFDTVLELMQEY